MQPDKTTSAPPTTDIVTGWLAAECVAPPECEVVRAIQECTDTMKLDEAKLLTKLRKLGEPEAETDVPR